MLLNITHSNMEEKVVLNIGGTRFVTLKSTLESVPGTRLAKLTHQDESFNADSEEHYFDRNAKLFGSILDFYRSGELHFSHSNCGPSIKRELDFWDIDVNCISTCCWRAYCAADEERETITKLQAALMPGRTLYPPGGSSHAASNVFDGTTPLDETDCAEAEEMERNAASSGWFATLRSKMWTFLEKPYSSKPAQAWGVGFFLLILLSIVVVCMSTLPQFRVPKPQYSDTVTSRSGNFSNRLYENTDLDPTLRLVDTICSFAFFAELLLRFLICPSKLLFFKSFYTMVDIFSVVPLVVVFFGETARPGLLDSSEIIVLITYFSLTSVLRVFRLFKLARHHTGLRILKLAVRSSIHEVFLLVLLILMGMVFFATLVYFAEFDGGGNFDSIPQGFWWAVVTMTTVGYGDMSPATEWGYLVGAVCAVCGILITGLPITVIASNVNHYYNYARVCFKMAERRKPNTRWLDHRNLPSRTPQCVINGGFGDSALARSTPRDESNPGGHTGGHTGYLTPGTRNPAARYARQVRDNISPCRELTINLPDLTPRNIDLTMPGEVSQPCRQLHMSPIC